jgi:hypothetical protein
VGNLFYRLKLEVRRGAGPKSWRLVMAPLHELELFLDTADFDSERPWLIRGPVEQRSFSRACIGCCREKRRSAADRLARGGSIGCWPKLGLPGGRVRVLQVSLSIASIPKAALGARIGALRSAVETEGME